MLCSQATEAQPLSRLHWAFPSCGRQGLTLDTAITCFARSKQCWQIHSFPLAFFLLVSFSSIFFVFSLLLLLRLPLFRCAFILFCLLRIDMCLCVLFHCDFCRFCLILLDFADDDGRDVSQRAVWHQCITRQRYFTFRLSFIHTAHTHTTHTIASYIFPPGEKNLLFFFTSANNGDLARRNKNKKRCCRLFNYGFCVLLHRM